MQLIFGYKHIFTVKCSHICNICNICYLGYIQIHVNIPSDKKLILKLKTTDIIENIKAMIQDKEGIPPDQQQLVLDGKQLRKYSTISGCNIKNESKLVLECKQFS